ncbi:MAG: hypothetical protein ACOCU6_01855 [Nanoarchaeota archaeon]
MSSADEIPEWMLNSYTIHSPRGIYSFTIETAPNEGSPTKTSYDSLLSYIDRTKKSLSRRFRKVSLCWGIFSVLSISSIPAWDVQSPIEQCVEEVEETQELLDIGHDLYFDYRQTYLDFTRRFEGDDRQELDSLFRQFDMVRHPFPFYETTVERKLDSLRMTRSYQRESLPERIGYTALPISLVLSGLGILGAYLRKSYHKKEIDHLKENAFDPSLWR